LNKQQQQERQHFFWFDILIFFCLKIYKNNRNSNTYTGSWWGPSL